MGQISDSLRIVMPDSRVPPFLSRDAAQRHGASIVSGRRGPLDSGRRRFGRRLITAVLVACVAALPAAFGQTAEASRPLRVVVISDLNESYGSVRYGEPVERAVRRISALQPDLVINTGDMIAGQRLEPPLSRPEIEAMWASFHDAVTEPLARAGIPMVATPGNHDASSGSRFRLEREIYREQWLPRRPPLEFLDAAGFPFSYAFSVGQVLFVSIDATFVGHLSAHERAWVRGVLDTHGPRFRHRIVFSHVPLWPFTVGRDSDYLGDTELEAILRAGRVDLYLSGHHHAYYPGAKDGVRYVSQACLGAAPRPLIGASARSERGITVLDIPAEGPIRVEAYRAPDYVDRIERRDLPARVASPRATLVRDDLAPDLSGKR